VGELILEGYQSLTPLSALFLFGLMISIALGGVLSRQRAQPQWRKQEQSLAVALRWMALVMLVLGFLLTGSGVKRALEAVATVNPADKRRVLVAGLREARTTLLSTLAVCAPATLLGFIATLSSRRRANRAAARPAVAPDEKRM
jgi:hypothetical protein